MNNASQLLLQALKLEQQSELVFIGADDGFQLPNPYGGRLLGQALSAAGQTVDSARGLHSMHAYFMRTGKRALPIEYRVQALRDGGSFSSRRVEATQQGKLLFACMCGFHSFEPNTEAQLLAMPTAPDPETLPSNEPWPEVTRYEQSAQNNPLHPIRSFDLRFIPDLATTTATQSRRQLWVRQLDEMPCGARQSESLFAWFSDFFLLPTVLKSLGVTLGDPRLRIASLDHALWIHQRFHMQEWLLVDYNCSIHGHSRAHTEAKVFDQQGKLVASLVQEGLLQLHDKPPVRN